MKELPNVPRFAQWLEDRPFKDMVEMATDPVCGMAVGMRKPYRRSGAIKFSTSALADAATNYWKMPGNCPIVLSNDV